MKSMLLSIMFCLISSVSWGMLHSAENALWTDLVENPGDGLVYNKFLTMPFTGTVMATADDPIQRSYIDGSKHGEWIEFNANGMVLAKRNYKDGKPHGLMEEFNKDGSLKSSKTYENGVEIKD